MCVKAAGSGSVLQDFSITKKAPEQKIDNSVNNQNPTSTDTSATEKRTTGRVPASNINLQDSAPQPQIRVLPAIDNKTQEPIKTEDGKELFVKVDENDNPIDADNKPVTGDNPAYVFFVKDNDGNFVSPNAGKQEAPSLNVIPELDEKGKPVMGKDGKPSTIKVLPVIDEQGQPVNGKDGKQLLVKVDDEGKPIPNKLGQPIVLDSTGKPLPGPEQPHIMNRINWLSNKMFARQILEGVPKFIVKKVAEKQVSIALEAVKSGAKVTLAKGFKDTGKVGAELLIKEAAKKTITSASGKAIEKAILTVGADGASQGVKVTVKALTKSGRIGQGTQALLMKESRAVYGKIWNPVAYGKAIGESGGKVQALIATEIGEKGLVKGTYSIGKKTVIGATEKTLEKGLTEGAEAAVKSAMKSIIKESAPTLSAVAIDKIVKEAASISIKDGSKAAQKFIAQKVGTEAAERIASTAFQKGIAKAAQTGTAVAAEKTSVKIAQKFSAAAPFIGAGIGIAITAWDAHHAMKLQKDPNVTGLSKGFAWATVGLDAVGVVADATGVGKPISWAALGLSIGTSIASDVFKNKKPAE